MTLQQIKCFTVLAETLHYTKAASLLFISQPSLSYTIAQMEKELGVALFERQGKKVKLTKHGEAFLPYAKSSLAAIENGRECLERMAQPKNSVNLGYIYSLSFDFLPSVISGFTESHHMENLAFNFYMGLNYQLLGRLESGALDLALAAFFDSDQLTGLPIHEQEIFLVVPSSHPLAPRGEVKLSELRDEKFVMITPNSSLRKLIDDAFKLAGFEPRIAMEAEECNAMASFVGGRFGLALMPKIPSLSSYQVSLLHITDVRVARKIYLVWKKDRELGEPIEQLKQYILGQAAKISGA